MGTKIKQLEDFDLASLNSKLTDGELVAWQTATAQTTDATVTSLGTATLTVSRSYQLEAIILAEQSDESQTNTWKLRATLRRKAAGAAELIGTFVVEYSELEDVVWVAIIDVSSNDVRIRVTGEGSTTINWKSYFRLFEI